MFIYIEDELTVVLLRLMNMLTGDRMLGGLTRENFFD